MAKTKREYVLATCFLSGAAAIISFVALGTQEWVVSDAISVSDAPKNNPDNDHFKVGLFGGMFRQVTALTATFELTTTCAYDLNICAYLCGDNMVDNLRRLHKNEEIPEADTNSCPRVSEASSSSTNARRVYSARANATDATGDKIFINAGVWVCTILFLIFSGVMGVVSAGLAVWNTAANPYQSYFSIFGLYIYNAIALFSIILSVCLWGGMFAADLIKNIPSYKTLSEEFSTENKASLGYSYWINLASLFLYMASICVLYIRSYLISKEPKVNLQIEDTADPVIYLY